MYWQIRLCKKDTMGQKRAWICLGTLVLLLIGALLVTTLSSAAGESVEHG